MIPLSSSRSTSRADSWAHPHPRQRRLTGIDEPPIGLPIGSIGDVAMDDGVHPFATQPDTREQWRELADRHPATRQSAISTLPETAELRMRLVDAHERVIVSFAEE